SATWDSPVTLEDVVEWVNAGNPVAMALLLRHRVQAGGDLSALLPVTLGGYACFHGAVAAGCLGWAVASLRACAQPPRVKRAEVASRESVSLGWGLLTGRRPRVFRPCVLWKA